MYLRYSVMRYTCSNVNCTSRQMMVCNVLLILLRRTGGSQLILLAYPELHCTNIAENCSSRCYYLVMEVKQHRRITGRVKQHRLQLFAYSVTSKYSKVKWVKINIFRARWTAWIYKFLKWLSCRKLERSNRTPYAIEDCINILLMSPSEQIITICVTFFPVHFL